jgi:hypothetical protein
MHGTELGIKLSGDLEIAIQTEMLTVALLRSIEVGGVHGSIKGGEYEMTFRKLKESTRDADKDLVMPIETSLPRHGRSLWLLPNPKSQDTRRDDWRALQCRALQLASTPSFS